MDNGGIGGYASAITDVALQQAQRSTAAKNDMLTIGSKLDIYA